MFKTKRTPGDRLIAAGTHERVLVIALKRGDVNGMGETIESVHRYDDHNTLVIYTNGRRAPYSNALAQVIIEKR